MTVSFIIPAYNANKTINRCLESIYSLGLPENDYEIIIIDDASTDNTTDIVQNHLNTHDNVTLLRQCENHRQGAARNRGITVAKGEFIVFVDSDDEVDRGLTRALQLAANNNLDMVAMRYAKVGKEGKTDEEVVLPYEQDKVFNGIEMQTEFAFWCTAPWAYVYRKAFLFEVKYPFAENVLFEDSDFVNIHLFYAGRMSYCDDCCYLVHFNETSTTHTNSFKHVCDYAILGNRMITFYQNQIEDKSTKYAEIILEGGSYNIMRSCRNLFKLESIKDVQSFYLRFDQFCDRKKLTGYRKPAYCWNRWTRFCIKHKTLTTLLVGAVLSTHVLDIKKAINKKCLFRK